MPLTTIADTLYGVTGDVAPLRLLQVGWPSFFNADNHFIPSGTLTIQASLQGSFRVDLEPTVGQAYQIVYTFTDPTTGRDRLQADFWIVPISGSVLQIWQVHVSGISVPSSTIVSLSQLASSGATSGQALVWNGTSWAPANQTSSEAVNSQTGTSYTFLAGDAGGLVTFSNASAIAAVLPQATGSFGAGWHTRARNAGAGLLTITPTTSTIDGASSAVLMQGQSMTLTSNGTNYLGIKTLAGLGTGTPSIATGAGAGTSPTGVSVSGSNLGGTILLTTGTATVGSGIIATITFASVWAAIPSAVMGSSIPIDWTTTTTTLVFRAGPEGLLPSTSYSFTYVCFG